MHYNHMQEGSSPLAGYPYDTCTTIIFTGKKGLIAIERNEEIVYSLDKHIILIQCDKRESGGSEVVLVEP
jgi:hypothetical protein